MPEQRGVDSLTPVNHLRTLSPHRRFALGHSATILAIPSTFAASQRFAITSSFLVDLLVNDVPCHLEDRRVDHFPLEHEGP